MRLLVNTPNETQEVIDIGQGGGYFDSSRVLWDEREDGPLPEITLGGMVREGNALAFSQARMDEHVAATSETPQQVIDRLEAAIQRHLDETAQSRGYDHILSLISYRSDPWPRYAAEGQAGFGFRSAVWRASEIIQADVLGGLRPVPTEAELIAELPAIQWPA